jgi:hypothetical protein
MAEDAPKFRVGAKVQKVDGHNFPGIIVSVFRTMTRQVRYVVESDHPDFLGMLQILKGDELEERK